MKVLMLVATSVATDTRVLREARALAEAGHGVHIVGRSVPTDWTPPAGITVSSVGTSSVFRAEGGASLAGQRLPAWKRLARWALAKNYDRKLVFRSPEFKSLTVAGDKAVLTFDLFGSPALRAHDSGTPMGFAVCGEDHKWVWATAKITGKDAIEVSAKDVPNPVAVRYAWADNPTVNLTNTAGLPASPFRTDDFPASTEKNKL